jgi:photosystem II stability/assembly factor-like uncharacterized protein
MATIKKGTTIVLAGTKKGLYIFSSRDRKSWKPEGHHLQGSPIRHAMLDPRDGRTIWAGGLWAWQKGAIPVRSTDFGGKWHEPASPIDFKQEGYDKMTAVWQIAAGSGPETYVGLEPAALFRSDDDGKTWQPNEAYNSHPTRRQWMAGNGGLCTHTILPYPKDEKRMMIASSGPAVFGTNDGGASWRVMNGNIEPMFLPEEMRPMKEDQIGACPHKAVRDAKDPARVYLQHHGGVLTRRRGDDKWTPIEKGLPSNFGFPIASHPHDAGVIYTVPLSADMNRVTPGGKMRVYRSRSAGKKWEPLSKGLPQKDAYFTILRDGLRTDNNDPAGVYVGTQNGQLYGSRNEGDSWSTIAEYLPPILSVEAGVVGETR